MRYLLLILLLPSLATGCARSTTERLGLPPVTTVEEVDLERYMGVWYEIASYPQRFQKGCAATTATYSLRDDGMVRVVNRCSKQGRESTAEGRARLVDRSSPAKLQVSFFGPFWGDYWVVDLGEEYEFAVVGHPGRDYLWILSRTPTMDAGTYDGILGRLREQGFELDRLQKTRQPVRAEPTKAGE